MNISVEVNANLDIGQMKSEVVERKGIGHPDTLADGIAEVVSRSYSNYCLENFGYILHHNADKTGILGGAAIARFGGGEIISPITVNINGRFSTRLGNHSIPCEEIIHKATREYIKSILVNINGDNHLQIQTRLNAASSPGFVDVSSTKKASRRFWFEPRDIYDLSELSHLHSNDTSCGVGYAPLSPLEKYVLNIEKTLNSADLKEQNPQFGTDIKIMGVRHCRTIGITAAIPLIDSFTNSVDEYLEYLKIARKVIFELAPKDYDVELHVNTRDKPELPELYLTVTGSSIESGDEGLVGRGNRPNGLITPMRLMSIEGANGKNPVYHIGKLYNVLADRIAWALHYKTGEHINVVLVSQSGRDLVDPWFVSVAHTGKSELSQRQIQNAVEKVFGDLNDIRRDILLDQVPLY